MKPDERRAADRYEVTWSVDCETPDTFLYASITNISALGIFVQTTDPLPIGTRMTLRFAPPGGEPFTLHGLVQWVNPFRPGGDNPNPGMGIQFVELSAADRERLIEVIKTIAYVREGTPREQPN
ncbi:MAG: TIGR02266 family protein [Deltaproteobacteria bacterium]|nr:TIGR02266 family protein [Deltaproteobacteria bacterium]